MYTELVLKLNDPVCTCLKISYNIDIKVDKLKATAFEVSCNKCHAKKIIPISKMYCTIDFSKNSTEDPIGHMIYKIEEAKEQKK